MTTIDLNAEFPYAEGTPISVYTETYRDHQLWIKRNPIGLPLAYVEVRPKEAGYGEDFMDGTMPSYIPHGGFTYADFRLPDGDTIPSGAFILGWDYGHCCDFMPIMEKFEHIDAGRRWKISEILEEAHKVIDSICDENHL